MIDLDNKERVIFIILALVLVLGFGINYIYQNNKTKKLDIVEEELKSFKEIDENEKNLIESVDINKINDIIVHISGAVKNPGVIEISLGKRLVDVVELAGGLKEDADLDSINLAKKVEDEERIHIPHIGEEASSTVFDNGIVTEFKETNTDKVNINTCSKEELMTLPGIGEKTSDKILEYRQDNEFTKIEDIMSVSGIGDKKFEEIKNLIKVN